MINSANFKVEFAQVFDTYKTPDMFDLFIENAIPDGMIVAAACQDECMSNLSKNGINWF